MKSHSIPDGIFKTRPPLLAPTLCAALWMCVGIQALHAETTGANNLPPKKEIYELQEITANPEGEKPLPIELETYLKKLRTEDGEPESAPVDSDIQWTADKGEPVFDPSYGASVELDFGKPFVKENTAEAKKVTVTATYSGPASVEMNPRTKDVERIYLDFWIAETEESEDDVLIVRAENAQPAADDKKVIHWAKVVVKHSAPSALPLKLESSGEGPLYFYGEEQNPNQRTEDPPLEDNLDKEFSNGKWFWIGTDAKGTGQAKFKAKADAGTGYKDAPEEKTVTLLPVEVAVDADRDGEITFDGNDKTTAEKPFRFWINNDQDDVEADEPVEVDENSRDLLDNTIKTKRDLEDFTRIKIAVGLPLDSLKSGQWKVGLKFRDSGGQNPSIRIWPNESDTGSESYLTDGTVAGRQISEQPFGETYSGTVFIPASYWTDRSDTEAHLIFEGTKKGMGELILVLKEEGSTAETETASLHLNLLDVREMYQRARIVNSASEIPNPWVDDTPPAQTWAWDPWNWPYSEDPEAEEITAIFVHGWRLTYNEYLNWSQTSYKRLWHQGFKGKFYSFRWATFSPSLFTYNDSEYRAWLCGPALASWVNSLPHPSTKRNIFAHSMGNVICGAALREGMEVENYALCNAAMAAMAYDPSPALRNKQNSTEPLSSIWLPSVPERSPDTHPSATVRDNFGLENKFHEGLNLPVMFSFGLPNDSALSTWVANNLTFKPDSEHSYFYQETPIAPNISYNLLWAPPNANPREVNSRAEVFAYVTKSLTRAAGADLRTGGAINDFQDMDNWGAGANHSGFNSTHSAQWRWMNQSTHLFWENLFVELNLGE